MKDLYLDCGLHQGSKPQALPKWNWQTSMSALALTALDIARWTDSGIDPDDDGSQIDGFYNTMLYFDIESEENPSLAQAKYSNRWGIWLLPVGGATLVHV